jgi:hypothetical protein
MAWLLRQRGHHARDWRGGATTIGVVMAGAPFLLHREHEGGDGNMLGKKRKVGAHPSGVTPAGAETRGRRWCFNESDDFRWAAASCDFPTALVS